jgi:hypothetical protein
MEARRPHDSLTVRGPNKAPFGPLCHAGEKCDALDEPPLKPQPEGLWAQTKRKSHAIALLSIPPEFRFCARDERFQSGSLYPRHRF